MTFNGKRESEQKYYEETRKSIQDSDRKTQETRNLDYAKAYIEYCRSLINNRAELENNLEPQDGLTPGKLDSALRNGLSALGYTAVQWALPTDCVHWGYPQEPLILCKEASSVDCNLYCEETPKALKDKEKNLLSGVSDFYKNLETAYRASKSGRQGEKEGGGSSSLQADYLLGGGNTATDVPKAPLLDCSYWERGYPSLISPASKEEEKAKRASSKSEKRVSVRDNSDRVKSARDKVWTGSKFDAKGAEEQRVKNERRTSLAGGHYFGSNNWQDSVDMSGQYPGHSRPPVGTPPPQNVWNHLTMAQGQGKNNAANRGSNVGGAGGAGGPGVGGGGSASGVPTSHDSLQRSYERVQSDLSYLLSEVSGLNMHASGLSGASLNSAGFYTHPSMARAASHLTSQLTPQLAHTQAPPTWHTPTVPSSKSVAAPNAPGNPLYSLQLLVDNRQNQNQYRNSPGSQNTLDLSATSEMAENYSRMNQEIPISLTARNVDKGGRNGNIISPPIPLNGETSSDSGISSSVPTPNSLGEPVSLSTKDLTTPKITVKNFESNLKGVANLHDKIKEMGVDNFAQKVINLPPSVTIERVITGMDKKDAAVEPLKMKDTLSVIAQVPRNVLPVIVNLTSRIDKDAIDSPMRESSSERDRKIVEDNASVRSPKNMATKRSANKKGVDSLLEKLEGGNKKLGSTENIGSVIVTPLEEKDNSSVKSMSPDRQKSKSPTRDEDVVSPAFSNDDSNDQTKQQRRKRKLEKPVRLSKDSKTEVEDMELEPTEPREPRVRESTILHEEPLVRSPAPSIVVVPLVRDPEQRIEDRTKDRPKEPEEEEDEEEEEEDEEEDDEEDEEEPVIVVANATNDERVKSPVPPPPPPPPPPPREEKEKVSENPAESTKTEENEPIKRRRSSEGPGPTCQQQTPTSQRTRRKSSDDAIEFSKVTSPKGVGLANSANPFNQVESELEKMFAGIVETDDVTGDPTKAHEARETRKDSSTCDTKNKKKTDKTVNVETKEQGEEEDAEEEEEEDEEEEEEEEEDEDTKCTKVEPTRTDSTDVTSTVLTTKPSPSKKGKKPKARGGKRKISKSRDSGGANQDLIAPNSNSKKRKGSKVTKTKIETPTKKARNKMTKIVDGLREISYDSGSNASSIRSRGPVVHVEGPRDSPLSVQVVNAPREDEEEKSKEKRKSVGNGNAGRSKRLSHQNDLDYRGKVSRAGLFSSTLSSRYDAHTTDSTWVCVFCKQGPHSVVPGDPARPHPNLAGPHIAPGTYTVPAGVLSDLFGPYLIGKERLEEGILSADEQEITTEQKKGSKNKRSLRYAGLADQFSAKMGKKKRNSVECPVPGTLTGMTLLPGDEQRWEVWLHEQCALWAAGVYMAGGRVTGLQEAVWDSTKSICGSCGLAGANIGCVKRGCKSVTHYPCALTRGWLLDTSQYIPKCNLHRVT